MIGGRRWISALFTTGVLISCKSQDEKSREAWIAYNCPGITDYVECQRLVKAKQEDEERKSADARDAAAQAQAAAASAAAAQPPAPSARPLTAQERARALAAIAELKAMSGPRLASFRNETDEQCERHVHADDKRVSAVAEKLGDDVRKRKTRYSAGAPYIGWDVDGFVRACLSPGCLMLENPSPGEIEEERTNLRGVCSKMSTVLDDLAGELRAAP